MFIFIFLLFLSYFTAVLLILFPFIYIFSYVDKILYVINNHFFSYNKLILLAILYVFHRECLHVIVNCVCYVNKLYSYCLLNYRQIERNFQIASIYLFIFQYCAQTAIFLPR